MKKALFLLPLLLFVGFGTGCSFTKVIDDHGGAGVYDANQAVTIHQTNIDLTLLFSKPVWGDATMQKTVADLGAAAKANNASTIRQFKLDSSTYWWIFPPFSFVIHPVVTQSAADAIR